VWVFDVREGLQPNGYDQITASDYVYLIEELHQSSWANTANAHNWSDITVSETGEFQFQAELPSVNILYPESFDPLMYPIPQGLVEPYVNEEDTEGLQQDTELLELGYTGNMGAYDLEEWNRGSGATYSRRDDYYLGEFADELGEAYADAPYFEGVDLSIIQEQSSRLGALTAGEADSAAIPPERVPEFQENPDVNVNLTPQPYNEIVAWNMRDNGWNAGPGNLFRHKEVRQGLSSAVDTGQLITGIYRGLAEQHHTWQPKFSRFYPGDEGLTKFGEGDLYGGEVARDLIRQGIERSEFDYQYDGDALVTPDGNQVELQIFHSAGQATERDQASFLAQEYEENAGIVVNVEAIEGTRYANEYWTSSPAEAGITDTVRGEEVTWNNPSPNNPGPRSEHADENWDMSMVYGLNTYPLNPLTAAFFFDGANTFYNPVGYYPSTDLGPLWDDARTAASEEELQTAMNEIFLRINEDQPYGMLAFPDSTTGYRSRINGPIESFHSGYDFETWFADE
jgi:Bacterial extracellular solute-binding proteins, family 5 Middle.